MTTYVTLAEFTGQAVENITDTPELIGAVEEQAAGAGGELRDVYVTLGEYDVIVVSEFPDDESYAEFALALGSTGGLTTESLRAFTEEEYRDVADGVAAGEQPLIWGDS